MHAKHLVRDLTEASRFSTEWHQLGRGESEVAGLAAVSAVGLDAGLGAQQAGDAGQAQFTGPAALRSGWGCSHSPARRR